MIMTQNIEALSTALTTSAQEMPSSATGENSGIAKTLERIYYPINEQNAHTARNMWSFTEYVNGTDTAAYTEQVNTIYDLGDQVVAAGVDADRVKYYCDRFSKQYALWLNDGYRIEMMCPSVMISGAGNFPVRKKEKQNAARDKHFKKHTAIMDVITKLKSMRDGTSIIKSGDADAIERLQEKLEGLEDEHAACKAANAHWRKHGNLDDFEGLTEETKQKVTATMAKYSSAVSPFYLTDMSRSIKATKERLDSLIAIKERGSQETENKHCTVVENTELMRLQLQFDGKPSEEVRNILKRNGFKWAPSQSSWQRVLNNNARFSLRMVLEALDKLEVE